MLNEEQLAAIYCEDEVVYVNSGAGTGKTTTLVNYAESYPEDDIVYLVFNSSMKKSAKSKFPSNTKIYTIDSLAYNLTLDIFGSRSLIKTISVHFMIDLIPELKSIYSVNKREALKKAIEYISIFNSFLMSDVKEIEHDVYDLYLKMIDPESDLPITHAVILKYFSENYDFDNIKFDAILIDEAQDLNLQMLHIINKIKSKKIFVGDPKQAIYGFRNTINVFNTAEKQFKLTHSYRFGSNIAEYVEQKTITAYGEPDFVITGMSSCNGTIITDNTELTGPYNAYITRTNAHMFDKAFELSLAGKTVSIPFDWDVIKEMLTSLFYLRSGLLHKIPETSVINKYKTYQSFIDITELGGDIDLKFMLTVLDKHGSQILDNIKVLERQLSSARHADVIIMTAHKSKGLEFYSVEVGVDFQPYTSKTSVEEKNLIYVAMTRAMENLKVTNIKF